MTDKLIEAIAQAVRLLLYRAWIRETDPENKAELRLVLDELDQARTEARQQGQADPTLSYLIGRAVFHKDLKRWGTVLCAGQAAGSVTVQIGTGRGDWARSDIVIGRAGPPRCEYCGLNPPIGLDDHNRAYCGDCVYFTCFDDPLQKKRVVDVAHLVGKTVYHKYLDQRGEVVGPGETPGHVAVDTEAGGLAEWLTDDLTEAGQ